jgi:hypothetical protein
MCVHINTYTHITYQTTNINSMNFKDTIILFSYDSMSTNEQAYSVSLITGIKHAEAMFKNCFVCRSLLTSKYWQNSTILQHIQVNCNKANIHSYTRFNI